MEIVTPARSWAVVLGVLHDPDTPTAAAVGETLTRYRGKPYSKIQGVPRQTAAARSGILPAVKSKNLQRDRAIAVRILAGECYATVAAAVGLSPYRCREILVAHCIRVDRLAFMEAILASRDRAGGQRVCFPHIDMLRERRGEFV